MFILLRSDIESACYIMMAGSSSDHVLLLQNINLKLQHVNDYFECFKEDFENVAFVGNNIKMRLKDCCIDAIVPFNSLLDKFVDILTTFDRGLKSNLDAWLRVESTLVGK